LLLRNVSYIHYKIYIMQTMIAETTFIRNIPDKIHLLKNEAIDRLDSVVDDLPKYKIQFEELIEKFTIEDMLCLMNAIYRDSDFKASIYYKIYDQYFDEIEDLIHKYV
jgi:hypothetical protein